jgi:hypothetical protein
VALRFALKPGPRVFGDVGERVSPSAHGEEEGEERGSCEALHVGKILGVA